MSNVADAKKLAMFILVVDGDHRISRSDFEKAVNKNDSDKNGREPADIKRLNLGLRHEDVRCHWTGGNGQLFLRRIPRS